ncbi:putative 2-aminoethylphosphonate ABC transporter substrate-binding protein [Rhizomicrobium palustre]
MSVRALFRGVALRETVKGAGMKFSGIVICAMALLLGGCQEQKHKLVVYTAAEADQLPAYEAAFHKAHPEIELVWVRDSTGVVTAKLLAEKNAPQADVVFALAASSLLQLDAEKMLQPYTPRGEPGRDARFNDPRTPPHWSGEALWSSAICVNTVEIAKRNVPVPQSWEDLTKPIYRGMIVMPDPGSSGTGLLTISAWLQMWGEAKGWDYMNRLDKNIAQYVHSGSKPCKDAARGEIPIGLSFDFRAAKTKGEGAPIEIVIPKEGTGWDIEASAIIAGTKHSKEAEAFMDWAMSADAMRVYAKSFAVVAVPKLAAPVTNLPSDLPSRLAKADLNWLAQNRTRVIDTWSARYAAHKAPTP